MGLFRGPIRPDPDPYFRAMAHKPYLVGIAGGSGSGKTSLIRALKARLPDGSISVVSQDDYYFPLERQVADANGRVNFDLPSAVDLDALAADLVTLRNGMAVRRQEYTFNQAGREGSWMEIPPAAIVLVEGLFILHHAPVREQFDLTVFVDASEEVQLERRLRRDALERGYGPEEVNYQWHHHVLPAYRSYLLPYRGSCGSLVGNEREFAEAADNLHHHLKVTVPAFSELALQAV
jgi:uridine kinase